MTDPALEKTAPAPDGVVRRKWPLLAALALLAAFFLGMAVRGGGEHPSGTPAKGPVATVWTCSMHPQIRLDHPGSCPICGMDLVPVSSDGGDAGPVGDDQVALGPHARAMAQVETALVSSRLLTKELRTVGKVEVDETAVAYLTARIDGRVDRVFADFPGTVVAKGDHLVEIYSPDLYTTQQELLGALRIERQGPGGPVASTAARRRLELWGITPEQVEKVVETGEPLTHLTVNAPLGGTVIEKTVRAGQYVKTGDSLYTIADLGRVWVTLDVYERDLAWVRFGQPVELTVESAAGRRWSGSVAFVEPVLNEATRTVRVRVVLENPEGTFKPGMFAQALMRAPLKADGTAGSTGLEGKHTCPMHPFVVRDAGGKCPVCGMDLILVPGEARPPTPILAVPAEAVLTTGVRRLVYVEDRPGVYRLVEPTLGPRAGDHYPVLGGLTEGQRVVTRGNFLLDSQFQISGKPSLLYPEGGGAAAGHDHGGGQPAPGHEGHATPTPPSEPPLGHTGHEGYGMPAPSPATEAPPAPDKPAAAQVYTCPMHPEVTSPTPGECPKCGMDLVLKRPGGGE